MNTLCGYQHYGHHHQCVSPGLQEQLYAQIDYRPGKVNYGCHSIHMWVGGGWGGGDIMAGPVQKRTAWISSLTRCLAHQRTSWNTGQRVLAMSLSVKCSVCVCVCVCVCVVVCVCVCACVCVGDTQGQIWVLKWNLRQNKWLYYSCLHISDRHLYHWVRRTFL